MIPAATTWPVTWDTPAADLVDVEEGVEEVGLVPVFAEPEVLENNHIRFEDNKEEELTRSR